jgi:hypothetical protein
MRRITALSFIMSNCEIPKDTDRSKQRYWAGRVAQAVECLPSKYKALSSNAVPPKKKTKQTKNLRRLKDIEKADGNWGPNK